MARRWADPGAFRPDPATLPATHPSRRQALALLVVLVVVAGVASALSYLVRPDRARSFDLLHGSVLIADQFGPVTVDLGSGKGTLQLRGAAAQAGATNSADLSVVPFDDGTLLLNRTTGEFNTVDATGFVTKRDGGVSIGRRTGATTAVGVAAGQQAYIVRTGAFGTDVLLVGPSTVDVAASSPSTVEPRASYSAANQAIVTDGGAASAGGTLWAFFRNTDGTEQLRRLSVPAGSSTGAHLRMTNEGTFAAPAAVETASPDAGTVDTGTTETGTVGVVEPGRIEVFTDHGARTVRYRTPAALDTAEPTTSARGRLSWLLHGSAGWSVLSVRTDGTGLMGPTALRTIAPDAQLAPAAQSLDMLYTMLRSGTAGTVYRVGLDGTVTAARAAYPQKLGPTGASLENASFTDGYLVARDSRVIVDSPSHYLALTLFTDGSHAPYVIQKTNLTTVNAAAGAEALTKGPVRHTTPAKTTTAPPRSTQVPVPEINNKINCEQTDQKPHVPQIVGADPSSRSVGLSWTYPVIDSQDCLPSTYVVSVRLLSSDAPAAPGSVTLQGHLDAIIGGLFPSTDYELTVTAYIHGQATSSQPLRVTTGKQGPAAPKNVAVTTDAAGNWTVSWNGCGTVAQSCVPVDSWSVQPTFCDGLGLSASPAAAVAPADPTSLAQPKYVFRGGDALLGRSLQFRVVGTGDDGSRGTESAASPCVRSHGPAVPGDVTLTASAPPQTGDTSASTTTTAAVSFRAGAQHDLGGIGGTINYQLLHDGTVVDSVGPTTATTATLSGIKAGLDYKVQALLTPPGQSAPTATVGPVAIFQATSAWPAIGASVDSGTIRDTDATDAAFAVQITGLTSADAAGERFDVTYQVTCGSAGPKPVTAYGIDPANPITVTLDRLQYSGSCSVTLQRVVESSGSGVFGGTPAPHLGTSNGFTIDQPTLTGVSADDFDAQWSGTSTQSAVHPSYHGSNPVLALSQNWAVAVTGPNGDCQSGYTNDPTLDDVKISQACVDKYAGSGQGWTVTITVSSVGGQTQGPFTVHGISGTAPSYVPPVCDVSSLGAQWSGTAAAPSVSVAAGNQSALAGCGTTWSYTVVGPDTPACAVGTSTAAPPQVVAIDPTACTDTPSAPGWSVTVGYTDVNGAAQTATLPVTGDPPS